MRHPVPNLIIDAKNLTTIIQKLLAMNRQLNTALFGEQLIADQEAFQAA